jgi:hypothetical protein
MIQGTEQVIELKWNFLGGAPHSHSIVPGGFEVMS